MIKGEHRLALTLRVLNLFDQPSTWSNAVAPRLRRFRQLLQKLPAVLLQSRPHIHAHNRLISLDPLQCLQRLELRGVHLPLVLGLNSMASRLTSLHLNHCSCDMPIDRYVRQLFTSGDWCRLQHLQLSHMTLTANESFVTAIPKSVQILEMRWCGIRAISLHVHPQLTNVDLSFNFLHRLPDFKETNHIRVLTARHNQLERLDQLHRLDHLEILNVASNCLMQPITLISNLQQLPRLQCLDIRENPLNCKSKTQLFNDFKDALPQLSWLNGLSLINTSNICDRSPADLSIHVVESANSNILTTETSLTRSSHSSNPIAESKSNEAHCISQTPVKKIETEIVLRTPLRASTPATTSGESHKKRPESKPRIAVILEPNPDAVNDYDTGKEQQSIKLKSNLSNTSFESIRLAGDKTIEIADILAQQRLSLSRGQINRNASKTESPLVTTMLGASMSQSPLTQRGMLKSSVPESVDESPQTLEQIRDEIRMSKKESISACTNRMDESIESNVVALKDDTIIEPGVSMVSQKAADEAAIEETERSQIAGDSVNVSQIELKRSMDSVESPNVTYWEDENPEGDHMFLVEKRIHSGASEPMFLAVHPHALLERHFSTAQILSTLDPLSLVRIEELPDLWIRLTFESKVRARQQVEYRLESESQRQQLQSKHLQPILDAQTRCDVAVPKEMYECLNCSGISLSSDTCGKCGSSALVKAANRSGEPAPSIDYKPINYGSFKNSFKEALFDVNNKEGVSIDLGSMQTAAMNTSQVPVEQHMKSLCLEYSLDQFTDADFELKLHLEVKVYGKDERLYHCFACAFVGNNGSDLQHGALVLTNTQLHFIARRE